MKGVREREGKEGAEEERRRRKRSGDGGRRQRSRGVKDKEGGET